MIDGEYACNFALYSKHAESVTLLLYTESDIVNPVLAYRFDYLKNKTGRIWHCRIPFMSMRGASYYAYRVDGPAPNGRLEWHAFDRDKILLDPYAKSVFFPPAFDRLAPPGPVRTRARRPWVSLRATASALTGKATIVPGTMADTVIYELHAGGFTRNPNSGVRNEARGTFAGPVYSYKGIDNSTYYLMKDRPGSPYENFSGTGNTLNTANRYIRKMIMDSARHWAHKMRVDGFRFDLAFLFTRNPDGSVNADDVPLLSDMASDPDLAHLRLIAEPWDAAGVYQPEAELGERPRQHGRRRGKP